MTRKRNKNHPPHPKNHESSILRACLNLYDADFEEDCQMDFCLR